MEIRYMEIKDSYSPCPTRWVDFSVIADNLINIGGVMEEAADLNKLHPLSDFRLAGAIDHNAEKPQFCAGK
jgi:hypothetical protein